MLRFPLEWVSGRWDWGFESRQGHISVVSCMCYLEEISETDRLLLQRDVSEYGVFNCMWSRYLDDEEAYDHYGLSSY